MSAKMPVLFISHGGGPWPYIPEMKAQFKKTAQWLSDLPKAFVNPPKAIVSISGHWEESQFTVSTAANPPMIFDYSGFPEHTYHIKYPAAGDPKLANRISSLLNEAGIKCDQDANHGFDHGTFVPLVLMYPNANIPVVSMSIQSGYDPLKHFQAGQALKALRDEGVLIIGSGLTYHNMRGFGSAAAGSVSQQFGGWLEKVVIEPNIEKRKQLLLEWEKAPAARQAHPYEDHLIPLMMVVGAAGEDVGHADFKDHVMGVDMASYRFGKL